MNERGLQYQVIMIMEGEKERICNTDFVRDFFATRRHCVITCKDREGQVRLIDASGGIVSVRVEGQDEGEFTVLATFHTVQERGSRRGREQAQLVYDEETRRGWVRLSPIR
jgi:hypothetical protein